MIYLKETVYYKENNYHEDVGTHVAKRIKEKQYQHCKNARTPDVCSQNYTQCVGV